jgi:tRNA threonylcarbamoyl adenosine modification protein (Sua5/YciO/YrdC/YwlC family)
LGEKNALERIRRIRKLDDKHNFTLVCRDLSELGTYARVDNGAYRLIRNHTPGPYTFILKATDEVPRRLLHPKRRTIGLRVPENPIALALLESLGEPLMSVTLLLPGEELPMIDPELIRERLEHELDLVIDGGACDTELTSVIDLADDTPNIIRVGRGDVSAFES